MVTDKKAEPIAEVWRDIPGFEGHYQVSSVGRLRSLDRVVEQRTRTGRSGTRHVKGKIMALATSDGYRVATLTLRGNPSRVLMHRAVAAAFIGPLDTNQLVRHLDGDRSNNVVANLAYGTYADNAADTFRHGNFPVGARNGSAKLSAEDVLYIRENASTRIRTLARRFGVSKPTIVRAINGENWKSLDSARAGEVTL